MTTSQRITRLTKLTGKARGVDRCLDNVRHARRWGDSHPDVAFWLDQGECYAGIISAAEFNARHPPVSR